MDLTQLRQEAIEELERYFRDNGEMVPSEDSDAWEEQYRRQFALAKERHAGDKMSPPRPQPAHDADHPELSDLPALLGTPPQIRWAEAIRQERLLQIPSPEVRRWLATSWTAAKLWLDSRDQPTAEFLRKVEPYYRTYRLDSERRAAARATQRRTEAEAAKAVHRAAEEAGVTPAGVIELIDVSPRVTAAGMTMKLADLRVEGRHVRVFETADPTALLVIDENTSGRAEYGIERDDGLVADLKLAARI
jgi:hypothetical protein